MPKVYYINTHGFFTGEVKKIKNTDPIPHLSICTNLKPPEPEEGKVIQWDGSAWNQVDPPFSDTLPGKKQARLKELASIRWEKENGGVEFGMTRISTGDRTKLMVSNARFRAKEDPTFTKRWKISSGEYIEMSAAMILALAQLIDKHIDACFDRETELAELVMSASSEEELNNINFYKGWPL